jgi:hypothetical protein
MKKVAWVILVLTMVIFLVNPLSSDARGGYGGGHGGGYYGGYGGGHYGGYGGGYYDWWAPWAVIGGAAVLAPYYYPPYYYAPPPVVIREQPPVYQPAPSVPPSTAERMFIYPRKGQSEKLQAKDRYECHRWVLSQTGYDPIQPTSGMPEVQLNHMRADYQRAMGACLDGRGYTMK